jgi:hypothetical protein
MRLELHRVRNAGQGEHLDPDDGHRRNDEYQHKTVVKSSLFDFRFSI